MTTCAKVPVSHGGSVRNVLDGRQPRSSSLSFMHGSRQLLPCPALDALDPHRSTNSIGDEIRKLRARNQTVPHPLHNVPRGCIRSAASRDALKRCLREKKRAKQIWVPGTPFVGEPSSSAAEKLGATAARVCATGGLDLMPAA